MHQPIGSEGLIKPVLDLRISMRLNQVFVTKPIGSENLTNRASCHLVWRLWCNARAVQRASLFCKLLTNIRWKGRASESTLILPDGFQSMACLKWISSIMSFISSHSENEIPLMLSWLAPHEKIWSSKPGGQLRGAWLVRENIMSEAWNMEDLVYVSTNWKIAVILDDRPKKDKTRRYLGAPTSDQKGKSAPQITSSPLLSNLQEGCGETSWSVHSGSVSATKTSPISLAKWYSKSIYVINLL